MLHNSLLIQITLVACYVPYLVSVALTPKRDTQREPAGASREERDGTVRTKLNIAQCFLRGDGGRGGWGKGASLIRIV